MEKEPLSVAAKIRLLRSLTGYSLTELAERSNVPYGNLSSAQNDNLLPGLEQLIKVSDTCKIHPVYWYENMRPDVCFKTMQKLPVAYSLSKLPPQVFRYIEHGLKAMATFEDIGEVFPYLSKLQGDELIISDKYNQYVSEEGWKKEIKSKSK